MKKNFLLAILVMASCLAANVMNAQLRIFGNGRILVGSHYLEEDTNYFAGSRDTTTMLKIYAMNTDTQARLSFGDQLLNFMHNVMAGEMQRDDEINTNQLWLHGRNGFYVTSNHQVGDTVFYFDTSRGNTVNFNYPIKSQGVLLSSDERFKENIRDLGGALDIVGNLHSVSYNYKSPHNYTFNSDIPSGATEKDRQDVEKEARFYNELENDNKNREHYGFLAQEVQQVLPDLVTTDKDGFMYVDYIGLIPVLVNAIQELQGELAELKGENPMVSPSVKHQGKNAMLTERSSTVLSQNDPNPFTSDTNIGVCLPDDVAHAAIYIYDLQGKQVRRLDVTERGQTSVTLHGGDLQAGMYIYSLIADGKELASKKMILTK